MAQPLACFSAPHSLPLLPLPLSRAFPLLWGFSLEGRSPGRLLGDAQVWYWWGHLFASTDVHWGLSEPGTVLGAGLVVDMAGS